MVEADEETIHYFASQEEAVAERRDFNSELEAVYFNGSLPGRRPNYLSMSHFKRVALDEATISSLRYSGISRPPSNPESR